VGCKLIFVVNLRKKIGLKFALCTKIRFMQLSGKIKIIVFSQLAVIILLLNSCSTTYQSGFNYYKNKINIDLSNHNLSYQFIHDSLFEQATKKQIDTFDYVFLTQFRGKIKSRGYQLKPDSSIQNMRLENCLIDFSYGSPKLIKYTYDSFYVNQFASTLVCQTNVDSANLFSATFDMYQEFEIEPKSTGKNNLDPTKTWLQTENYYYHLKPISQNQGYLIARNLSERAASKLDSINEAIFIKNNPQIANQTYKKRKEEPSSINGFVNFIAIVAVTLISILLNV